MNFSQFLDAIEYYMEKNDVAIDEAKEAISMKLGGDKMGEARYKPAKIKASDIEENDITEFVIKTVPEIGPFDKLECEVIVNDAAQTKWKWAIGTPVENPLFLKWTKDTTSWVGKTVPVKSKKYDSGMFGIVVDAKRLEGQL